MRTRRIVSCLGFYTLGALAAGGAEIRTGILTPQTPRAALRADADAPDRDVETADAAFAAWLKAHRGHHRLDDPPTLDEIKVDLRRHNRLRALLGDNRWRRLERARFQVHLHELRLHPDREFELVSALYGDIEGSMRSNFSKIARDWAEHRLGLAERFDDWEQRRDHRRTRAAAGGPSPSVALSPRFGAGADPYLGTKIRLRHAPNGFLSHLSLNTRYYFDGDSSLRLTWQTHHHYVSLERIFDERELGDVLSLSLRFTF